jgi:hypothetical protein
MAEDEAAVNGGTSQQAPGEDVDVNRRQQQANLSSIPEGAEAEGEDDEDAMVGPVLPKARKRRVSSLGVLPSTLIHSIAGSWTAAKLDLQADFSGTLFTGDYWSMRCFVT